MEHVHGVEPERSSPPPRPLIEAARAMLRIALAARSQEPADQPASPLQLRRAVRLLCDDARRHGMRAEQLVVVVKEAWDSFPESRWRRGDDAGVVFLQRVVSVCIEEYYAGRRDDALRGRGERPAD